MTIIDKLIERIAIARWRIDSTSSFFPRSRDEWIYVERARRLRVQIERERNAFAIYLGSTWRWDDGGELGASERNILALKLRDFLAKRTGKPVRIIAETS